MCYHSRSREEVNIGFQREMINIDALDTWMMPTREGSKAYFTASWLYDAHTRDGLKVFRYRLSLFITLPSKEISLTI